MLIHKSLGQMIFCMEIREKKIEHINDPLVAVFQLKTFFLSSYFNSKEIPEIVGVLKEKEKGQDVTAFILLT